MNFKKKTSPDLLLDTRCPSSSERKEFLTKNGSILQEKLIATFGPRYKLPIRCFSAKEIFKFTNNFTPVVNVSKSLFLGSSYFDLIRGHFQERPILVAKVRRYFFSARNHYYPCRPDEIIHNIVISSQMCHLEHVLKLIGCCLEFEFPVLVYEYVNVTVLYDFLYQEENVSYFTNWRNRIKIIQDIAYSLAYLHDAFPTTIIHQKLDLCSVFVDQSGNPKFLDFSYCLPLPPGKMQFQISIIRGNPGFIDPEFRESFSVTPKTDVYSIGVLLFVLVTGRKVFEEVVGDAGANNKPIHVSEYVRDCLVNDQLSQVAASEIWESDEDRVEKLLQLKALMELALRCTLEKGEDRPHMIEVARKLHQIYKT